ncbi:hypothetical protein [Amycolatopsis sp. FDAARGOS 1241]|uniref:hypothetical protein n=1 Tax=Amycolatopsis sp. FDAARGOS 1241 TaxID=2778070 RepID=UPI00195159B4|nr:hypothetical protein [Amycolatopsis sp. FDAARGOS 1241]QRP51381.1 hypothetical protein I6J71_23275 [Amycolatopsis sp. FDAARGOS 1241]
MADPPDDIRAKIRNSPPDFGYSWTDHGGALVSASKPIDSPKTLAELSVENGELDPWTETPIAGLPAVIYHVFLFTDECSGSAQVTDDQMPAFELCGWRWAGGAGRWPGLAGLSRRGAGSG